MNTDAKGGVPPLNIELLVADASVHAEVTFDVIPTDSTTSKKHIEYIVALFQRAVGTAMFSGGRNASLEIASVKNITEGRFLQQWKINGIEPGGYRVFINMLEIVHIRQVALASVRLVSPPQEGKRLDRHAVMASDYPARGRAVPFGLRLKRVLAGTKNVLVRLEFTRELRNEEVDMLEGLFVTWDRLITHGGYGSEFGEVALDDSIVRGETYMASPDTLEHEFICTIGQAAAFEPLINMAIKLHRTFCPLTAFEIG